MFSLSDKMNKLANKVDVAANEISKEVALELVKILVFRTPVDTSQALSNWQVGIRTPVNTPIGPYAPGAGGSTKSQSRSATIERAKLFLASKRKGEPIFVSNVLDYIADLNDGTSKQAPKLFVETSVDLARKRVQSMKLKI